MGQSVFELLQVFLQKYNQLGVFTIEPVGLDAAAVVWVVEGGLVVAEDIHCQSRGRERSSRKSWHFYGIVLGDNSE